MDRKIFGIIGILAAATLFAGDMLLYGHFGSAPAFWDGVKTVAANASLGRLYAGGIIGPIGGLLYILGFWHIYLNTQQAGKVVSIIVFTGCTSMMVLGGAYHALWTIRMLLYKFGIPDMESLELFIKAVKSYSSLNCR